MLGLKLIIVHYHLRPGGIRRIIELATPYLVEASAGRVEQIVVASGETGDKKWNDFFMKRVAPTPVEFFLEPAFNYLSEQRVSSRSITRRIHAALERLLYGATNGDALIWAHNLGVGRNLILARELVQACDARRLMLVAHHHDWWFDNRWLRWPEMRRFGFRTLESTAKTVFPASPRVRHLTINRSDAMILERHVGRQAGWLPNLTERTPQPSPARLCHVRDWLQRKLNDDGAPVWLLPCRLLRRKNVAEALLLTRWLRPEAWLMTAGGASSGDEQNYADKLGQAANQFHWRLRLGVLAGDESRKPSVAELLAVSEAVMLTSVQEGFGLPYLEAAASRRPLVARAIANIAPDLEKFGFNFPQYYREILVHPSLFDRQAEQRRQENLFNTWRRQLPRTCRRLAGGPILLAAQESKPVPFSRLTLTAQLEILVHPAQESWKLCVRLNPFLAVWKRRAAGGRLQLTPWPRRADGWLSGPAYARRFSQLTCRGVFDQPDLRAGAAVQKEFIHARLDSEHLFPLLWAKQT